MCFIGKSTACIQAILKHYLLDLETSGKKIFVCEPRKVAADGIFDTMVKDGVNIGLPKNLFGLQYGDAPGKNYPKSKLAVGTTG